MSTIYDYINDFMVSVKDVSNREQLVTEAVLLGIRIGRKELMVTNELPNTIDGIPEDEL